MVDCWGFLIQLQGRNVASTLLFNNMAIYTEAVAFFGGYIVLLHKPGSPFVPENVFCKHQEDILDITLWLTNVGCDYYFVASLAKAVYMEAAFRLHNQSKLCFFSRLLAFNFHPCNVNKFGVFGAEWAVLG